jgi:ribosomal protein S18 acetylase RimI-like enzyme
MSATEWLIVPARLEALAQINSLIARSKSYWPYPSDYLALALPLLEITEVYVAKNECFEIHRGEELAAFASLAVQRDGTLLELDYLWVEPRFIGRGAGTFACRHLLARACERGWHELYVLPDPPAKGFYEKLGFVDTGDRVPSRVANGPEFSVLRIALPAFRRYPWARGRQ